MKLQVKLNQKSIKNAINSLKKAKKQLQGEMLNEFYYECYNYFVGRANYYLSVADIGQLTKGDIETSWRFERTVDGAKFVNDAQRAVFVEFGVGIVGERKEHPNADKTFYWYNMPSVPKQMMGNTGAWMFNTTEEELDIPQDAIDYQLPNDDGGITVVTYGTKGVWYAFNALEDLRLEYPKIWERIKIKYWG